MKDIKPAIRDFLSQFFGDYRLDDHEDIFASGFVNSLFIMQLVLFVEGQFSVKVEDEDLEMENFNTIAALEAFAARKRTAVVGG